MLRREELARNESCINRAYDHEMVFVLLARDRVAPWAVRAWCLLRVLTRKNRWADRQIQEALVCAKEMGAQKPLLDQLRRAR